MVGRGQPWSAPSLRSSPFSCSFDASIARCTGCFCRLAGFVLGDGSVFGGDSGVADIQPGGESLDRRSGCRYIPRASLVDQQQPACRSVGLREVTVGYRGGWVVGVRFGVLPRPRLAAAGDGAPASFFTRSRGSPRGASGREAGLRGPPRTSGRRGSVLRRRHPGSRPAGGRARAGRPRARRRW